MKVNRSYILKLIILFTTYLITAKSGLNAYASGQVISVIWPPSGIALVCVLLFGYKVWPAIPAAVLVLNLTQHYSILPGIELSIGNTVEPLLGAFLLQRIGHIHYSLDRVADTLYFIVLAAVVSTVVGATMGTTSLLTLGIINHAEFVRAWSKWWVGDMLGVLVVAPLLLVWGSHGFRVLRHIWSILKGAALVGLLVIAIVVAFWGIAPANVKPFIFAYAVFPLLVWISLRYRQIGSVTAIFIGSLVAILGTITTFAHTGTHHITDELFILQSFLGATAATFMIIAAADLERDTNHQRRLELATHAEQLAKQKAHLQALHEAKDDFITIASHQLKTPPTVIKQYTGMILDQKVGRINTRQRDMLQHVYDSNEKQLKVIRDIVNIAMLDTGHVVLEKENIDLVALITEIIGDKTIQFIKRKQSLNFTHTRQHYHVFADRIKLYMVLEHIIDNASKYTPEGKEIEIKLTRYHTCITISVKDQGIGFSTEDTRKLFNKFTRISNTSAASIEGTGIGLYWAKKIIDLHDGTIAATSRQGHGSTFRIILPSVTIHTQQQPESSTPSKTPAVRAGVTP